MPEYRSKLGNDGRIVIPSECRRALGLKPGDEVIIEVHNQEASLFSFKYALERTRNEIQKYVKGDKSLKGELFKMRKEDSKDGSRRK